MRIIRVLAALLTGIVLAESNAIAQPSTMPPDAKVYIIWPPDGAVIRGSFWVRMGLSGAGIAPAGVQKANTGHHHLLVDTDGLILKGRPTRPISRIATEPRWCSTRSAAPLANFALI